MVFIVKAWHANRFYIKLAWHLIVRVISASLTIVFSGSLSNITNMYSVLQDMLIRWIFIRFKIRSSGQIRSFDLVIWLRIFSCPVFIYSVTWFWSNGPTSELPNMNFSSKFDLFSSINFQNKLAGNYLCFRIRQGYQYRGWGFMLQISLVFHTKES